MDFVNLRKDKFYLLVVNYGIKNRKKIKFKDFNFEFSAPGQQETLAHSSMIATITFVLYHSYALALVAMMVRVFIFGKF